ncbi:MAG: permease [Methanohalobium sp.]|uniref:permease n=1 Tax=Methanohalobium sp. TaxID=2837493 RepID=UPI0039790E27
MTLIIILLVGLLLGFIPPEQISRFVGEQSGLGGVLLVGIAGAVMHIPAILSFPLVASFLESGASVTAVAVFITTLTMIGTVTLPLEIKELGKEIAFLRNG